MWGINGGAWRAKSKLMKQVSEKEEVAGRQGVKVVNGCVHDRVRYNFVIRTR